ncbi:MAG: ABC transporter permease [Ginsengibacter sp.]
MLKNLLLVALRNFKRDKWYSLLNMLGLTIGITFSLFLIFYIKDELSYDRYNEKADRMYRIVSYDKEPDRDLMKWSISPDPLAPELKKNFPEVEEAVRFNGNGKQMLKSGETRIYEDKIFFCDSNVFKVFTYHFIEGNPNNALVEPNSMVLTKSVAEKFFGKNSALGKSLQNDKGDNYKITGVVKDVPENSHIIFNVLISMSSIPGKFMGNWGNFGIYTYVLLKPHTDKAAFEKKMGPLYDKFLAPLFAKSNIKINFVAQPLLRIHLYSDLEFEPEELGSISYIYIFGAVALFMLLIACINYMNLATARSARRAKEIGIRKVTGSTQLQLIAQFLIESVLTTLFALLLSVILIALLLPTFNLLSGKSITFQSLLEPSTLLILTGIILFVGLAGGSYPAFYLSKFNPVHVLKGSLSKGPGNVNLRRSLVVVQFSISMIMLICTWVVYGQLQYLRNKDVGFNKDQVLSIGVNANNDVRGKVLALKNEIQQHPGVSFVSTSQSLPGQGMSMLLFSVETKKGYKDQGVDCYGIDKDYFKTLGMQLKEGRNFSGPDDTLRSIIVNEKMADYFGWDNAIGKKVKFGGDTSKNYFQVVGVVKDFNQKSLYNPISPLLLFYRPNSNNVEVKLNAKNIPSTIAGIEKSWKTLFPGLPFQYTFLDQDFNSQYAADQKRGKIFTVFSILTILITCLGLLGLIAFTTQQRQKEISIRKIMGAGVKEIIPMIAKNFIILVGISCLVAFPIAYIFMDKWLKIFTYNTGLSVIPFLLSALAVLIITMLTVVFHTVKAAVANPVKSLRTE